jgi:hypothetical protein
LLFFPRLFLIIPSFPDLFYNGVFQFRRERKAFEFKECIEFVMDSKGLGWSGLGVDWGEDGLERIIIRSTWPAF